MSDGDTPRARANRGYRDENRLKRWLLLDGDRRGVTLALSTVIFLLLVAIGTVWSFEIETLVRETRSVQTLFTTLLNGVILFVSVVVTLNAGILSEEFGPLSSQQEQLEQSLEFQSELESFAGNGASPAEPGEFFRFVLDAFHAEVDSLRGTAEDATDPDVREAFETFVDDVDREIRQVNARLEMANLQVANVLLAGLDYGYAQQLYVARHLRAEFADRLSDAELSALDDFVETLKFFAAGREYFKTLYVKREIGNLSGGLLVLSLPVIVFTAYALLAIDAGLFPPDVVPGISRRLFYVAVAFSVSLSPYVLLTSYLLRIVTVSKRSLGSSSFALPERPR